MHNKNCFRYPQSHRPQILSGLPVSSTKILLIKMNTKQYLWDNRQFGSQVVQPHFRNVFTIDYYLAFAFISFKYAEQSECQRRFSASSPPNNTHLLINRILTASQHPFRRVNNRRVQISLSYISWQ